ncbi:8-oxoguanine deaminase [Streptomyces sp. TRM43335]|uniref:8-oxoguanine deaminase n=1 Tax=Streptomyces taklimakanensis TaxID=2569853 RepID=A0A6G2BGZ9_9ACTN|nr:8-oxoguanine deaminase [Streptomyces taklimakanensis]MTE21561.1 8-oxoguanine deaminase [Streptomyces taklimakanensis]
MTAPSAARTVIENCAVATVDADDTEHAPGHVVVAGETIESVGAGPAPVGLRNVVRRVDGTGHLLTPGLVNAHHHVHQWLTRGMARDDDLIGWLSALYPVWTHLDEDMVRAAARASLTALALGGVTCAADHHYMFPRGSGDPLGAVVGAAREVGLRLTVARGSMDLGESGGGLPPDAAVESTDEALAGTERAIDAYHDPSFGSMLHVAVAPSAPFAVTDDLMRGAAETARRKGVRLHTHGLETADEERICRERFGTGPVEYFESTGWLGEDVWMAHGVHLDGPGIDAFARTGTGVAHCPSSNARLGAGRAPVPALLAAGVPVGLGVDGAASNEAGDLRAELRNALLVARLGPRRAKALTVRQVLRMGTRDGARVLGRAGEIGSLEPGRPADLVLWRLDGLGHSTIADPVAALVLGPPAPVALSLVGGRVVVEDGRPVGVDEETVAREAREQARRLARLAGREH